MKTKTIKQSVRFNAGAIEVYQLIMDEKKHSQITSSAVSKSKNINGKFRIFDVYFKGYHIALIEGHKIVQAWHFEEDGWPTEHYSICTFLFDKSNGKTNLKFTQQFVPELKVESLKKGWKEYYWEPMKMYLNA